MWLIFALLSAICAALVAIFAKMGLRQIDPTLATTVRSVIMAIFLVLVSLAMNKFSQFSTASFNTREWILIILAGVAGALSWLFYFVAIKAGNVSAVVAIDRLSIVFVVLMAALFLGDAAGWRVLLGAALIVGGAILISIG